MRLKIAGGILTNPTFFLTIRALLRKRFCVSFLDDKKFSWSPSHLVFVAKSLYHHSGSATFGTVALPLADSLERFNFRRGSATNKPQNTNL